MIHVSLLPLLVLFLMSVGSEGKILITTVTDRVHSLDGRACNGSRRRACDIGGCCEPVQVLELGVIVGDELVQFVGQIRNVVCMGVDVCCCGVGVL